PSATSILTGVINTETPSNLAQPSLSTTTPVVGQKLTATTGTWIGVPTITYEYEWQHCVGTGIHTCFTIPGADEASYVPAGGDAGLRLRVVVEATNEHGSESAASSISQKVEWPEPGSEGPPVNEVPPSLEGVAVVGGLIHADVGVWSGASFWEYAWRRCDASGESCVTIPNADQQTYSPVAADQGQTLRVVVTGHGGGQTDATSAASEPVAPPTQPVAEVRPQVQGEAEIGEWLVADPGEWSGSPVISFDYRWKRCDADGRNCVRIPADPEAGSQLEYSPVNADAGKTLRLEVTASNGWGSVTTSSQPTEVIPAAPPLENLALPELVYETPRFGSTYSTWLLGSWTGAPAIEEQWQRCDPLTADPETEAMECVDVPGADDAADMVPGVEDIGFKLRLKLTATSPGEESQTVHSLPSVDPVADDVIEGDPSYTGVPAVGATITVDSGIESGAGLPITTEYTFSRLTEEGPVVLQEGAADEYELTAEDAGYEIEVSILVSIWRADEVAAAETHPTSLRTPVIEVGPSNDTLPTIEGEALEGAELAADPGEWHGGGGPLTYAFQWSRCDAEGESCVEIPAATDATYTATASDVGKTLIVEVTAHSGPLQASASSVPTAPFAAADAPENEVAPTISGDLVEVAIVEADQGAWSGSEPRSYSYQWQGCETADAESCLDIEDATEPQLRLDPVVVDQWLRVVVTATNAAGEEQAGSELVGPVEPAPAPELSEEPSIAVLGPAEVGSTLLVDGGEWENIDPAQLEYHWLRCDAAGEDCEDAGAPDDDGYRLGASDLGGTVRVEVIASNSSGEVSATSEASPEIGESTGSLAEKLVLVDEGRQSVFATTIEVAEGEEGPAEEEEIADCESLTGEEDCTLLGPQISPDGKTVVIEERGGELEPGEGTLYLMNFDGSDPRVFATGSEPQWSEDGGEIYFTVAAGSGATEIVVGRADGSDADSPQPLPSPAESVESPSISAEGDLLAYAGKEDLEEGNGLYLAETDGPSVRRLDLGSHLSYVSDPVFSDDGEEIIFTAASSPEDWTPEDEGWWDRRQIWSIAVDGSNLHRLVPDREVAYGSPSVGPGGLVVARRSAVWVSVGGGGFTDYGPVTLVQMKLGGAKPVALAGSGLDPDFLRLRYPEESGPF
ncbi:MAG TPA: hypothetical protein VFB52_10810, partial [Solirubrobacterales bacterium]|nr:hypothetical protein [Solirubrobacterales bacterium]